MKKIFLIAIVVCGSLYSLYAQNLDFHESFSGYTGSQNPYMGHFSWDMSNTAITSYNGNAIIRSNRRGE